jgi:hypothetical protein
VNQAIEVQLEQARRSLLDLTLRNRLLNFREATSLTIKIVDELPDEVFRILVSEGKQMSFLASEDDEPLVDVETDEAPQPRHLDKKLQTAHSEEVLQKRMLRISSNARTILEEQGINVLYLALGFLNWFESTFSDKQMKAPLILIPVELTRESAVSPFKIQYSGEELTPNLSLHEKLQVDFGIDLPSFVLNDDASVFEPEGYFSKISKAVQDDDRWVVSREMFLGLFSFGKLMMYLDLDPANWPEDAKISSHPVIVSILEGLPPDHSLAFSDEAHVDEYVNPMDCYNVIEADSSQTLAILDVNSDRNMVIEGPPGTGKSQTITNIIAESLARDKKVLFVSEKMAALEVVKRRLDDIGLGDACLELHSHKARKSTVLDEIRRTLDEAKPSETDRHAMELLNVRTQLNAFASALNAPVANTGVTPFRAIGRIEELRSQGFEPVLLELPKPLEWNPEEYTQIHDLVHALAVQLAQVGNPSTCPWRGVGLAHLLPSDQPRITSSLDEAQEETLSLRQALVEGWGLLSCEPTFTVSVASSLSGIFLDLSEAPQADLATFANEVWFKRANEIDQLVSIGESYANQVNVLLKQINGDAFLTDLSSFAPIIREIGTSKGRIFNKDYRNALKQLGEHLLGRTPSSYQERIALLELWQSCQDMHRWLQSSKDTGEAAFGSQWRGPYSDWIRLRTTLSWVAQIVARISTGALPPGALQVFKKLDTTRLNEISQAIVQCAAKCRAGIQKSMDILELDQNEAFGGPYESVPLDVIHEYIGKASTSIDTLTDWIKYRNTRKACLDEGLQGVVAVANGGIAPDALRHSFAWSYYESIVRKAFSTNPILGEFSGVEHERKIDNFRQLDEKFIKANRQYLAAVHWERVKARVDPSHSRSEMALVEHEIRKKRRHLPIRKLIAGAGHALQLIKPCFMMSPMSIAQFLTPGALSFDLVVFDEASQVKPEDALGSVARGSQLVVVGDPKQLPPTTFFSRMLGLDDDDGEYSEDITDYESILDKCMVSCNSRRLRMHYRSRHESLIQFSNHEFYDDSLVLFPSPDNSNDECGVRFNYVPDGVYDRGRSRKNTVEAEAVAAAVMKHAKDHPHLKLGVGTFGIAQREAIEDAIEVLRREDSSYEDFFSPRKQEPFFVKNLENIQGDERDVIILSVGYGRDANGNLSMLFGPINSDTGWRRMNVLVTRARRRVEVFSSITYRDIDTSRTTHIGVRVLKSYLEFAETGNIYYPEPSDREMGSEFQAAVTAELEKHGLLVEPEVGAAGFFIDIGVKNPDRPGEYVLGIECDGASYHSAKSARDRDKLRQAILEDLGWTIHRIWSVDWFNNREREIRKALEAYELAMAKRLPGNPTKRLANNQEDTTVIVREAEYRLAEEEVIPSSQYVITTTCRQYPRKKNVDWVDAGTAASTVTDVVNCEGPIHVDEIVRRCSQLWGFQRAGSRIREVVERGISLALARASIRRKGQFIWPLGMNEPPIRNRAVKGAPKKADLIPPEEIALLAAEIKRIHVGISTEDMVHAVARSLGIARVSEETYVVIARNCDD